jgi:hypothetical protein
MSLGPTAALEKVQETNFQRSDDLLEISVREGDPTFQEVRGRIPSRFFDALIVFRNPAASTILVAERL